ncbi:ABC transporter permease subunit [Fervidibacillus albus]|uniref:ABC transporter permease subunit n=1 Tax=Fervidibacillus albus TaxID=2980026 RepID=A0A9E8LUM6_9BACI|nr:ABC transporter permease subunit [Fervidibacillus albus]WAA09816.1 ABC transporter permease subunit [Fervidibacillus albus]
MSKFFRLIKNELFKIFIRKSTWVMYLSLAALLLFGAFLTRTFDELNSTYTDNWREELQEENKQLEEEIAEVGDDDFIISYNGEQIAKNNYYLENDIRPLNYGAWQFTLDNVGLVSVISLFTIIIGAGIISNEYNWGTLKLLLIRPVSRTTVLFSKFTSVFVFGLITMIFLMIFSLLTGTIFFGFEGINPKIVISTAEGFNAVPIISELLSSYGYSIVNLIMMTTLAFMISTIFRNSSLAIGVGIFLLMGGNIIVSILSRYDWVKYILFANIDLQQYKTGNVLVEGMTLGFSITILIVHFLAFLVVSWLVFTKRDVVATGE